MKTSELLERALILIKDEKNWTKEYLAKDFIGNPCSPFSPAACQFCSLGAIMCLTNGYTEEFMAARDALAFTLKYEMPLGAPKDVAEFNDNQEHYRVMHLWKKTIHREKAHGN